LIDRASFTPPHRRALFSVIDRQLNSVGCAGARGSRVAVRDLSRERSAMLRTCASCAMYREAAMPI
jgi:hypothetical protein